MDTHSGALFLSVTRPDGQLAQYLATHGMTIVPILEDEGDVDRYVVSSRLAVERRTSSTFLAGIMDRTLFTSAIYLREHWALPVLIVEGNLNNYYSGFSPQAIRGALTSMLIEYGISVLQTEGVEETAEILSMLTRQEQKGIPEISLVPKRKADDLPDLQRRVVEMLPGCGRVMARTLLRHFGSVQAIAAADEKELRTVRGVGAKTAGQIRTVCQATYEAIDSERDFEDAVEHSPRLLFHHPATLLARQHYLFAEGGTRHVVDLVFRDDERRELVLVELKTGRLTPQHEEQLRRYLDHASESPLLAGLLADGYALKGMLATLDPGIYRPVGHDIHVAHVDRKKAIRAFAERNAP